jgi:hypothetical protein
MGFNRPLPPEGRALLPRESTPPILRSGADFSPCRTWRYKLSRRWSLTGPMIAFVGLNPSTADEIDDDPTVRRCIGFARRWGFSGMYMLNVFAYRSTNPRELRTATDPVGPRKPSRTAADLLPLENDRRVPGWLERVLRPGERRH